MSVQVEKTSSLGRRLVIEVSQQSVDTKQKEILKDLKKKISIDGFRPGHVPENEIMRSHGARILRDAKNDAFQTALDEVLKEQNLRPVGNVNLEDFKESKGQNLTYTVSFEVFPEIVLKDFSAVELIKQVADISEEDIDSGISKLQDQFATWVEVSDRPAQNGDRLTIDFEGYLDGEQFQGGTAKGVQLELGSQQFIPGFEEGLLGAKVGEQTTLNLTFPTDYNAAHLAGKATEFKVTVHKIEAKVPAVVDGEFAAKIGIEDKDTAKVRAKIKENMLKYVEDLVKSKLRDQALEKLYEVNKIEVPLALIEKEKHNLLHEKHGHAKNVSCEEAHGHLSSEEDTEITQQASKRVALGLLLNEIITQHKIQPDQDRILAKIKSMSMMYGGNAEFIQKMYYESKELRENIHNMVLTDQAADLIVDNATIKEEKNTFYGIVEGAR